MSKKKATAISLPLSRTAKIMASTVGVEGVNQDIVATVTKATEIFLTDFARRAYELSDSNVLDYDDITNLVHSDPRYEILVDTTPKRIKFSEALKRIEEAKERDSQIQADLEVQLAAKRKAAAERKRAAQEIKEANRLEEQEQSKETPDPTPEDHSKPADPPEDQ